MNAHSMTLKKTYPSGAEEWCCLTCGKWFIVQLSPQINIIEFGVGDENADHFGGTKQININIEDNSIWDNWMDNHNNLWSKS